MTLQAVRPASESPATPARQPLRAGGGGLERLLARLSPSAKVEARRLLLEGELPEAQLRDGLDRRMLEEHATRVVLETLPFLRLPVPDPSP